MDTNVLLDALGAAQPKMPEIPGELAILELRRPSLDELHRRARKLLRQGAEACDRAFDQSQWLVQDDHTLIRLPQGARAVIFHASGAFKLSSGMAPMAGLFKQAEPKAQLARRTEEFAKAFGVHELLGRGETLSFERLWQIKAAGADREGKTTEPVLCRAIGAFRHHIEGIPVLGPASVVVQLAGDGLMDSVATLLRSAGAETLERAKVIAPDRAVRQMAQQLAQRFGDGKQAIRVECPGGLRFGYFSLGKRKAQRALAPVYAAVLDIHHEQERQGLVMVVAATEKNYLPLDMPGHESPLAANSKLSGSKPG